MLCRKADKEFTLVEPQRNGKPELRAKKVVLLVRGSKDDADSRGRSAVRRIPTLERIDFLNKLHLCGNSRSLTAEMLGVFVV